MNLTISVIIPIYNGQSDLPELVHRLCTQTILPDYVEYILVDNNSKDLTWKMLQELSTQAYQDGYRLHPIQEVKIQSSYAARNAGIHVAQGDILVFTDVDCRPQPDWLEQLIAAFSNEDIGFVIGAIQALDGSSLLEQYAARKQTLSHESALRHPYKPFGKTANLGVRRSVLEEIGLFRPYLTTGGDADLCWRIQQTTHWQFEVAPTAIVEHRHRHDWYEFQKQWQRYGRSHQYLHELFGTPLAPNLKIHQYLYRASRWLLKELPLSLLKLLKGQATPIDTVSPLIQLLALYNQAQGQREASLPDPARYIEVLKS